MFSLPHDFSGDSVLREALASFFNRFFKPAVPVAHEHIVLTAGAGTCLEALVHSICEDGDSVIIPGPYWCTSHLKGVALQRVSGLDLDLLT